MNRNHEIAFNNAAKAQAFADELEAAGWNVVVDEPHEDVTDWTVYADRDIASFDESDRLDKELDAVIAKHGGEGTGAGTSLA